MKELEKTPSGIEGFDHVANGGVPIGRTTLVAGTSGSAKTILSIQFLVGAIKQGESGVFVTFEETPEDIRRNVESLGWDIAAYEAEGRFRMIDASPRPGEESVVIGRYDFGGLIARVERAVNDTGATRVTLDSLGAIFTRFADVATVRWELLRLISALRAMGVTSLVTVERTDDYGPISRFGVEEFVADNVILLRNPLDAERRRRTVEVLKMRGTSHRKGEYPFTIADDEGIVVIPLSSMKLVQRSSDVRVSSGNNELDEMCSGGLFRDSVILVSGATGTGKTLMSTEFLAGGVAANERSMVFAFEESRDQLVRNASGWGYDFAKLENDGLLQLNCDYPEVASLEDHLLDIKRKVERFKPNRVSIDSLSALERTATDRGFLEFVIGLTSFIKEKEIVGLMTSTSSTLLGGESVTDSHISTLTDSIVLLRYVEMFGEVKRGITVLKMRGSPHDKDIREFSIDGHGMKIGRPFRTVVGILGGNPSHADPSEFDRLSSLAFDTE